MNKNREILLKLVRVAMGWETDFSLPRDVDWKEVFVLAQEQGVNAIALDGIEKLMSETSYAVPPKDKQLIFEAIGALQMVELNNLNQLSALLELSDILHKKNIPFMIMKGFACAQYYPIPKHRPCGDIDIFPGDKYGESNDAFKEAGIVSAPYYYRHSALYIKNVMIENHKVLGDLRGFKKESLELESWLRREALKSISSGSQAIIQDVVIPGAVYPNANFNAMFLPWHISAHFAFEKVTIRHLLDWALFLSHDGKGINVAQFREAKRNFTHGYSKIADIVTNLSIRYLNMPTDDVPMEIVKDAMALDITLADKVLNFFFEGQPKERDKNVWKSRWNNIRRIWQEKWKYKEIYNMTPLVFLYQKIKGVIFKVGENE